MTRDRWPRTLLLVPPLAALCLAAPLAAQSSVVGRAVPELWRGLPIDPSHPCVQSAFGTIARAAGLAHGIEALPTHDESRQAAADRDEWLSLDGLTLDQILSLVVGLDPQYAWMDMDGVIVLRPRAAWQAGDEHVLHRPLARLDLTAADTHLALHELWRAFGPIGTHRDVRWEGPITLKLGATSVLGALKRDREGLRRPGVAPRLRLARRSIGARRRAVVQHQPVRL